MARQTLVQLAFTALSNRVAQLEQLLRSTDRSTHLAPYVRGVEGGGATHKAPVRRENRRSIDRADDAAPAAPENAHATLGAPSPPREKRRVTHGAPTQRETTQATEVPSTIPEIVIAKDGVPAEAKVHGANATAKHRNDRAAHQVADTINEIENTPANNGRRHTGGPTV